VPAGGHGRSEQSRLWPVAVRSSGGVTPHLRTDAPVAISTDRFTSAHVRAHKRRVHGPTNPARIAWGLIATHALSRCTPKSGRFSDSLTRLHPACVPIGMGGSNLSSKQLVSGRVVHANGDCDRAPYTHGALKVSRRRFRKLACAAPHVRHGIATRTRQWAIQGSRLTPTQRPPCRSVRASKKRQRGSLTTSSSRFQPGRSRRNSLTARPGHPLLWALLLIVSRRGRLRVRDLLTRAVANRVGLREGRRPRCGEL
jgi:hypothetical protein